jgi:hypothetical protein
MGLFSRLWQPYTEEYMFVWNSFVAMHTVGQLSDSARARVYEHYVRIVALNRLNPLTDLSVGLRHDPFWLAVSMADLGIFPMIGPKPAKWFRVKNPLRARTRVLSSPETGQAIADTVLQDIRKEYGLLLDPETLSPD